MENASHCWKARHEGPKGEGILTVPQLVSRDFDVVTLSVEIVSTVGIAIPVGGKCSAIHGSVVVVAAEIVGIALKRVAGDDSSL